MVFCASGAAAETADMSGLSAGSVNAPAKPTFPLSMAVIFRNPAGTKKPAEAGFFVSGKQCFLGVASDGQPRRKFLRKCNVDVLPEHFEETSNKGWPSAADQNYIRSQTVAIPWPKPIHMVDTPYLPPSCSSTLISVVEIRAPEQPSG